MKYLNLPGITFAHILLLAISVVTQKHLYLNLVIYYYMHHSALNVL